MSKHEIWHRCPYESAAEVRGLMINCEISANMAERIPLMLWAYEQLFQGKKCAIRFILPIDPKTVTTWQQAMLAVYPYQIDMLACQLYRQLWPLLSVREPAKEAQNLIASVALHLPGVHELASTFRSLCHAAGFAGDGIADTMQYLCSIFEKIVEKNSENVYELKSERGELLLEIGLRGITVHADKEHELNPFSRNRNCCYIVKCPLYGANTWRHSDRYELAVWQHASHQAVDAHERQDMRIDSNTRYAQSGVAFEDIAEQTPPWGFWIPRMRA